MADPVTDSALEQATTEFRIVVAPLLEKMVADFAKWAEVIELPPVRKGHLVEWQGRLVRWSFSRAESGCTPGLTRGKYRWERKDFLKLHDLAQDNREGSSAMQVAILETIQEKSCPVCAGMGTVPCPDCDGKEVIVTRRDCDACQGKGKRGGGNCKRCNGSGEIVEEVRCTRCMKG